MHTTLEGPLVATMIMLSFTLCGVWILAYLNISQATFKIDGGIILFLLSLVMPAAKPQAQKRVATTSSAKP